MRSYLRKLKKKGNKSKDNQYHRSEGGDFGSETDLCIFTREKNNFVIQAVNGKMKSWSPGGDTYKTFKKLGIHKKDKKVFEAYLDHGGSVDLFSAGKERFEGSKKLEKKNWEVTEGKIPKGL